MLKTLLSACAVLLFYQAQSQLHFANVAPQYDVDRTYGYGAAGGGVSFCDFDGDGLDDLTFATEDNEKLLFFRNTGDGFENLDLVGHRDQAKHVLWVDFDNDGDKDLYVTTFLGCQPALFKRWEPQLRGHHGQCRPSGR